MQKWVFSGHSHPGNGLASRDIGHTFITPDRRQSKTLTISTNVDQKSSETEFLIVICRPIGDKWQLKTLFLTIYPRSSIVKSIFDCRLFRAVYILIYLLSGTLQSLK